MIASVPASVRPDSIEVTEMAAIGLRCSPISTSNCFHIEVGPHALLAHD